MTVSQTSSPQRIARLTPLSAVIAMVERHIGAIPPRPCSLEHALGCALAEDAVAPLLPPAPIALRDGYAVEAAAIADASSYAPVPLAAVPQRVDVGEALPTGTDTVLPLDAVVVRATGAEAIAAVPAGDGALAAGGDAAASAPLRRAGERMHAVSRAAMTAAGITEATFRRPRVGLACGSAVKTAPIEAALALLARAVIAAGGEVLGARDASGLEAALTGGDADAVIAVGGTGSGRRDYAVQTLARLGRVEAHGIALVPGETAAFGFIGARPVLLVPGRLDATLAVWLLLGRPIVARLCGGSVDDFFAMLPLKRKVTSTIGVAELIPVHCSGGMAEPLGSGYLSLAALARSDGWIVVPPESEGFAARTPVAVGPWP